MHKLPMFVAPVSSPPPGLKSLPQGSGANSEIRKVTFAPDAKAPPAVRALKADAKEFQPFLLVEEPKKKDVQLAPPQVATVGFHCVHCGTKVPPELLGKTNFKFCVHCGKPHPESVLESEANAPMIPVPPGHNSMGESKLQGNIDALRLQRAQLLALASMRHLQEDTLSGGCW